ncbi:MAG: hypothetical protein ACREBW_01395, partial [Candidatus Micrarchaeaceae archaeon]
MIFGLKIPARTMRAPESTGSPVQHLPSPPQVQDFTVRSFMGTILNAVRPFYGASTMFGQDIYQLRLVFADWPQGVTEEFPVLAGDFLVLPMGADPNGDTIYRT